MYSDMGEKKEKKKTISPLDVAQFVRPTFAMANKAGLVVPAEPGYPRR